MARRRRSEPEWWAEWLEQRRYLEDLWERRRARFAAEDERLAHRRERLRRLTFGFLGRA
jgi:hypothetical protein